MPRPNCTRRSNAHYLLPLNLLQVRLAQQLVDQRFPRGVALTRLNNDGTVRYRQAIERLDVVAADADRISFTTAYPAGPFLHHTPRSTWHKTSDIHTAEPEGDDSRILSEDHSTLSQHERDDPA